MESNPAPHERSPCSMSTNIQILRKIHLFIIKISGVSDTNGGLSSGCDGLGLGLGFDLVTTLVGLVSTWR